jgi:phasin family protein
MWSNKMQDDLSNAFTQQASKMYEPLQKMQSLWVNNLQAFANFQMKAVEDYSKMGMSQMKSAIEIKEPQDYQAFSKAQTELMQTVNEKVIADNKQLTQMTQSFLGELESLWKEVAPSAGQPQGNAKKKAA